MNKGNMKIIQINTHESTKTQFVFFPNGSLKKMPWNWEGLPKPAQSPYYPMEFALADLRALHAEEKLPTKVKTLGKFQLP